MTFKFCCPGLALRCVYFREEIIKLETVFRALLNGTSSSYSFFKCLCKNSDFQFAPWRWSHSICILTASSSLIQVFLLFQVLLRVVVTPLQKPRVFHRTWTVGQPSRDKSVTIVQQICLSVRQCYYTVNGMLTEKVVQTKREWAHQPTWKLTAVLYRYVNATPTLPVAFIPNWGTAFRD
jgi:hypothetical protein